MSSLQLSDLEWAQINQQLQQAIDALDRMALARQQPRRRPRALLQGNTARLRQNRRRRRRVAPTWRSALPGRGQAMRRRQRGSRKMMEQRSDRRTGKGRRVTPPCYAPTLGLLMGQEVRPGSRRKNKEAWICGWANPTSLRLGLWMGPSLFIGQVFRETLGFKWAV
ncbi:unnamed protein product [Linum trigynum]|uniref:Uncharacterized protein n=1 Tax=Linum trigynum TaxID=586398 RepID=A0AAV2F770_9ROSI